MNDDEIVNLYFKRDETAISVTADKYGGYCYSIAKNILGDFEDAKECVNDTYFKAWNSIPPHKPKMLSTYLGKITRNLSFNLYKKNKADKRGGSQIPLVLDELQELVSGSNSFDEINALELEEAINLFLTTISLEKRKIFVCRYWYADSIKDIAKRFEITESKVSVTLNRLRKNLHNYLNERGFEL